jgi:hypothetical protein
MGVLKHRLAPVLVASRHDSALHRSVSGFGGVYTNNDNLSSHFSTLAVVR